MLPDPSTSLIPVRIGVLMKNSSSAGPFSSDIRRLTLTLFMLVSGILLRIPIPAWKASRSMITSCETERYTISWIVSVVTRDWSSRVPSKGPIGGHTGLISGQSGIGGKVNVMPHSLTSTPPIGTSQMQLYSSDGPYKNISPPPISSGSGRPIVVPMLVGISFISRVVFWLGWIWLGLK